jgi:class 3 adenylate cyclase/tetratricopeptide (TPR) repeat protein
MPVCSSCGQETPPQFRFCGYCGTPLVSTPAHEMRKTVTIVFSDLKGSTSLGELLDSEALREVMTRYFDEFRTVLERHGGIVEKFIGDAVMAVFGLDKRHEDDALRAVRAASEMQGALAQLNGELERRWGVRLANRTGVNTGEVVAGDPTAGQRLITGDAVNVAARLEQAAPENAILIGASTYQLVRDAVTVGGVDPLPLKGKADPVAAYRLLRVAADTPGLARRVDTRMVGREAELHVVQDRFAEVAGEKRCELVTILGTAGVGKSRLIHEFLGQLDGKARVLRCHCLPYGDGITFWALSTAVSQATGATPQEPTEAARAKLDALVGDENSDVAQRLAAVTGLSSQGVPLQEIFWAARRFFEILADAEPLVVVVEDIHWAEQAFLDLIERVCDTAAAPILLLCTARQELLDDRPDWTAGKPNATRLHVEPLAIAEGEQVVANLLGSSVVPLEVKERLARTAGGNPLYVEQTLSMLIDSGVLRSDGGAWRLVGDLDSVEIPPTIAALISARLDHLAGGERTVMERASVIGQTFYTGAVAELSPDELAPVVPAALKALTVKELVAPDSSTFLGEDVFSFRHILIRDAAYGGLLKRTRAELHERFVAWLEQATGTRAVEYEEIIGYHLEQAYRNQHELGPLNAAGRRLAARAAQSLGSAGRRALTRRDMAAATNLLERAVATLDDSDPTRLALVPDLAEALIDTGEFEKADGYLEQAIDAGSTSGDERLRAEALIVRMFVRYMTDPEGWSHAVADVVEETITILERHDDHSSLAKAWRMIGAIHGSKSEYAEAEDAMRRAVQEARLAGDRRQELQCLPTYALSAAYGPTPVPEAIQRCGEILHQCAGSKSAQALVLCALSHLHGLAGEFDTAREHYRRSRSIYEQLGMRVHAALVSLDSAPVEMLAGDPAAAERELRIDYETLTALGDKSYLPTNAALLARALHELGRSDEAEHLTHVSEQESFPDDVNSEVEWRCARAVILAERGSFDEAIQLARDAVDKAMQSDFLEVQANANLDLAEVLARAGSIDAATSTADDALALYGQKQCAAALVQAHRRLAALNVTRPHRE